MSLLSLPDELLHLCSFHLLAHKPLGPPSDLITLALVCRAFNNAVSSHTFRARICRFMFDTGAVSRRLFHPRDSDLADELHRCCNLLKAIRRADLEESEEETLIEAYILMLSNDGKNYAQLEHAGLDAYLDKYINTRLWSGRETNQGWPLDNIDNASALWLMWMTMTKRWSFFFFFDCLLTFFYIRKISRRVPRNSYEDGLVDGALCRYSSPRMSTDLHPFIL